MFESNVWDEKCHITSLFIHWLNLSLRTNHLWKYLKVKPDTLFLSSIQTHTAGYLFYKNKLFLLLVWHFQCGYFKSNPWVNFSTACECYDQYIAVVCGILCILAWSCIYSSYKPSCLHIFNLIKQNRNDKKSHILLRFLTRCHVFFITFFIKNLSVAIDY